MLRLLTESAARQAASPGPGGRSGADTWARVAALLVFLLGFVLIVAPAGWHLTRIVEHPEPSTQTTDVTTHFRAGQPVTWVVQTHAGPPSLSDEALAGSGALAWRFGLVVVAAFLAGALTQRTMLANFAMKFGPVEVPSIKSAIGVSERAIGALEAADKRQDQAIQAVMTTAADALEGLESRLDALELAVSSPKGAERGATGGPKPGDPAGE